MATENIEELDLIRWVECSECGGYRNCDVLGKYKQSKYDPNFSWYRIWYILACRGCEHTFVQTVYSDENMQHYSRDENGDSKEAYYEMFEYWPALAKRKRPDWFSELSGDIEGVLLDGLIANTGRLRRAIDELYKALDNDLFILSAIGVRTVFDIAAELLGINENQSFGDKLKQLVSDEHIGFVDMDHLRMLVDAGNASAHRGWRPKPDELEIMMDVLESFIVRAFIEPARVKNRSAKVSKVQASVPQRNSKKTLAAPKSKS